MRENRVKRLLTAGKPALGAVISLPDPFTAEVMATVGFDFLLVDTEHSPVTISELQTILIGLRGTEATILVRAAWNDVVMIKQILDVGAEGVIVPWVNTPEEAKRAVAAARYPPLGVRGLGPRRASRQSASPAEYVRRANEEILVIGQIETVTAVENLDGILLTPGLDAIMIGPGDLAASMGHIDDLMNPAVDAMIGRVLQKCKEHRVPFGMFAGSVERARQWVSQGGQLMTIGGDLPFLAAGAAQTKQAGEGLR